MESSMSPRRKEENEEIRERRKTQILDAALTVYLDHGFNGADMDLVARRAGLAKGLIYYYFSTKGELFRATFDWAIAFYMESFERIISKTEGLEDPIERLFRFTYGILAMAEEDIRMLRFAMRLPFDSYALFGEQGWPAGREKSQLHAKAISAMISSIAASGRIAPIDANSAATSFWAVLVANCFDIRRMVGGGAKEELKEGERRKAIRGVLAFCFQGIGIARETLEGYFCKIEGES
jgi:AcrR family transcriptional regulator